MINAAAVFDAFKADANDVFEAFIDWTDRRDDASLFAIELCRDGSGSVRDFHDKDVIRWSDFDDAIKRLKE